MYVKSRYEAAWFPRSSLSFCIFLLNYMYLHTGRYIPVCLMMMMSMRTPTCIHISIC